MRRTLDYVEISIVEEDRVSRNVKARAYLSRGGPVLLNDELLDELSIVILGPGRGLWCFSDELGRKIRKSY